MNSTCALRLTYRCISYVQPFRFLTFGLGYASVKCWFGLLRGHSGWDGLHTLTIRLCVGLQFPYVHLRSAQVGLKSLTPLRRFLTETFYVLTLRYARLRWLTLHWNFLANSTPFDQFLQPAFTVRLCFLTFAYVRLCSLTFPENPETNTTHFSLNYSIKTF